MADMLINLIVGLVGALVGGGLAWLIEIRRRRVEVTLALFSEFNTPTMLTTRHLAADKVDANPGIDFAALREQEGRAGMQDVWAVQAFYQKLWLLLRHRHVEPRLIPDLFGDRFAWWVQNHYASRLFALDTTQARDIQALWEWMERAAPSEQRRRWGDLT